MNFLQSKRARHGVRILPVTLSLVLVLLGGCREKVAEEPAPLPPPRAQALTGAAPPAAGGHASRGMARARSFLRHAAYRRQ